MRFTGLIICFCLLSGALSCGGRNARAVVTEGTDQEEKRADDFSDGSAKFDSDYSSESFGAMDLCEESANDVPESVKYTPTPTEQKLVDMGMVNIIDIIPDIAVEIVYATPNNFMDTVLYEDIFSAYLLPRAAQMLSDAQKELKSVDPELSLIVYDASRPMSVQRRMWQKAVSEGKQYYVANPANGGGLHNYGAAVDVSIVDSSGVPLPMGTVYDHLGPEANIDKEKELVAKGIITQQDLDNRLLLRRVMTTAGFTTVRSEWWHFNMCSRDYARRNLRLIDF